jgi:trehalose 6-phosphate phosphatase
MIAENKDIPTWPLKDDDPMLAYLKHILSLRPRGLCTDIDGTISLTAPTVDAAVLLPGMRELLAEATQRFDLVATISGRAIENQRRMIDVPGVWHVGHHGYEWEELDAETGKRHTMLYPGVEPYLAEVATALDEIEAELAPQIPGLWMERKGITGGVHWRMAEDQDQADRVATPVIDRIAKEHGLRCRGSKLAVELYPPVQTNKGEGLRRLVETHQLSSVIYLGDDVSDADAFREINDMRAGLTCEGIAIAVAHIRVERFHSIVEYADMVFSGPKEVQTFLQWLLH